MNIHDTFAGPVVISCGDCVMRMTSHCADCVVTFLCDDAAAGAGQVRLSLDEAVAIGRLSHAGLVPELRFRSQAEERAEEVPIRLVV